MNAALNNCVTILSFFFFLFFGVVDFSGFSFKMHLLQPGNSPVVVRLYSDNLKTAKSVFRVLCTKNYTKV